MLKQAILCLLLSLLLWSLYQRSLWQQDYSLYEAPALTFPPIDPTFESATNASLFDNALVISDPLLSYPEDIAVSAQGNIYAGTQNGSIALIHPPANVQLLHRDPSTGGVFGIILAHNDSQLYYVTEFKGLFRFDLKTNQAQQLLAEVEGRSLRALNNLCIDEQRGVIYITESTPFPIRQAGKDILLKHQKGRILFYHIATHQSGVFADNLAYPNGIVFDQATQSLIVSELSHYRLTKIAVPSKTKSTLVDNLFGYPDNLQLNSNGQLYVGMVSVRDQSVEYLNESPHIRKWLMYVPEALLSLLLRRTAGGIKVDAKTGSIKEYIFGDSSVIYSVTTLLERNGLLYMSSLRCPTVIVIGRRNIEKAGETQDADLSIKEGQQSNQL